MALKTNTRSVSKLAVVAVVMLAVVVAHSGVAEATILNINPFCRTSSRKVLCTKMVKGATNWHDAVKNAIESTMELANRMEKTFPLLLPVFADLPLISKDSAIQTCRENFDDVLDNLKESLGFLANNDTGSLNSYLSAVSITDCEEAFNQFNIPLPPVVARIVRQMSRQVDNCLAVSQQI